MSNILLILFPTQLFEKTYLKKIFSYTEDNIEIKKKFIIIWEHEYFFNKFPYHKMKLLLHRATMKKYYDDLNSDKEYNIKYIDLNDSKSLNNYIKSNSIDQIRFFNPIEKELIDQIKYNKIVNNTENLMFPSPYFFNSSNFDHNTKMKESLTTLRHDLFYKTQRIKLNLMVKKVKDKYEPEGSKWSFDTENRSPFEKTQEEPKNLKFNNNERQKYLKEAVEYVEKNFDKHYGKINLDEFIYPIDRKEAIEWLKYFIKNKLDKFGKFEDALSSKIKFGYHSILSPLTNIGLITPMDIIDHVKTYKKNIASKEGFLRQVIGWREYCYFTYDLFKKNLESTSLYSSNKRKIPKKVWECKTEIPPIDNILKNVTNNAYSHHIERLMGIGNFLILIGVESREIYNWFQTMYIDAYDVFMVPNVYGMLCYSKLDEKSHMMTRPYFSSSNYLIKMSDYKASESVKIKDVMYKWNDIYDALYWSHVNSYSDKFKSIYATSSAVSTWNRFDENKKKNILNLSKLYIS